MLKTSEEIKLLESAMEPGIRNPLRSERGPEEIIRDFMEGVDLTDQRVLELGPGHFEFCESARRRGASAEAVELDPPVIEFGRRRGFRVWPGNLIDLPSLEISPEFDGLFCKGSNNPFWFHGDEKGLRDYLQFMQGLVKPDGWLWIVSCPYGNPGMTVEDFNHWLKVESSIYHEFGFNKWVLPHRAVASFYGISFEHPQLAVYTRGLPARRWSLLTMVQFPWFCAKAMARRILRKQDA